MNFSGIPLHSCELGVSQPKVYGDIQSHHNMSITLHILSAGKYKHHRKGYILDIAQKKSKIDNVEIKIITAYVFFGCFDKTVFFANNITFSEFQQIQSMFSQIVCFPKADFCQNRK